MHWFGRGAIAYGVGLVVVAAMASVPGVLDAEQAAIGFLVNRFDPPYPVAVGVVHFTPFAALVLIAYGITTRAFVLKTDDETRCRRCDYILRGLTEPRCSECGERI